MTVIHALHPADVRFRTRSGNVVRTRTTSMTTPVELRDADPRDVGPTFMGPGLAVAYASHSGRAWTVPLDQGGRPITPGAFASWLRGEEAGTFCGDVLDGALSRTPLVRTGHYGKGTMTRGHGLALPGGARPVAEDLADAASAVQRHVSAKVRLCGDRVLVDAPGPWVMFVGYVRNTVQRVEWAPDPGRIGPWHVGTPPRLAAPLWQAYTASLGAEGKAPPMPAWLSRIPHVESQDPGFGLLAGASAQWLRALLDLSLVENRRRCLQVEWDHFGLGPEGDVAKAVAFLARWDKAAAYGMVDEADVGTLLEGCADAIRVAQRTRLYIEPGWRHGAGLGDALAWRLALIEGVALPMIRDAAPDPADEDAMDGLSPAGP